MLLSRHCFSMFLVSDFSLSFCYVHCFLKVRVLMFRVFFGGFSFKQNCEPHSLRVALGPAKRFFAKSFSQDTDK